MKYHLDRTDQLAVLRIIAIYAIFAALYIYLSNEALGLFIRDPATIVRIAIFKGFTFILVTAVLLYQLIARRLLKLREMEKELRVSQNLVTALIEGTTDAIFVKDLQGRYLLFNSAAANVVGKNATDVIGHDASFLFPDREAGAVMADDRRVMESGRVMTFKDCLTAADGTLRTFLSTKGPIFDATGELKGLFGISHDITQREQAEEALRESERRYRTLFEHMLEGYAYCRMIFDKRGRPVDFVYLEVNDSFERLTGLTGVVGKKVTEVLPGVRESSPELFESYGRVALTGNPERFEINFEPLKIWLSISVYSTEQDHFVAVFDNITERKRAEETREATIELLRICNGADNKRELMRDLTLFFQKLTSCEAVGVRLKEGEDFPYYETRGFSKEFVLAENRICAYDQAGEPTLDSVGQPVIDCMCGNIISGRFDPAKPFFTSYGSFWTASTTELLARTTDKELQSRTRNRCNGEGYESVALVPIRAHGETFGLFQFNDRRKGHLTAEKMAFLESLVAYIAISLAKLRVDEALLEASQFSRQIIASAEEGIIVYGLDMRFQVWNPFMEKMTGMTASEVIGKHPLEIFPFLQETGVIENIRKALSGQITSSIDFPFQSLQTGLKCWISDTCMPLMNTKGEIIGVIGTVLDITERKLAQDELQEVTHRLQLATAAGRLGIWDWDIVNDVLVWNERMYRALRRFKGYIQDES
jgi:PAS domain S-box-containing protein